MVNLQLCAHTGTRVFVCSACTCAGNGGLAWRQPYRISPRVCSRRMVDGDQLTGNSDSDTMHGGPTC